MVRVSPAYADGEHANRVEDAPVGWSDGKGRGAKIAASRARDGRFSSDGVEAGPDASDPKSPKRQPARKQAARRGGRASARSRSGRGRGRGRGRGSAGLLDGFSLRWPVLSQNQRDVLGLALVAIGVFMGFVLYGNWNGGQVGQGLAS